MNASKSKILKAYGIFRDCVAILGSGIGIVLWAAFVLVSFGYMLQPMYWLIEAYLGLFRVELVEYGAGKIDGGVFTFAMGILVILPGLIGVTVNFLENLFGIKKHFVIQS